MIIHIVIAVLIGIVGSYLSYFNPKLLSTNIEALTSSNAKWSFSVLSLFLCISSILYLNPNDLETWIEYGVMITLFFISCIDGYSKIVPNRMQLILFAIISASFYISFEIQQLISAVVVILLFGGINLLVQKLKNKNAFGWGDIKLITVLALYLGWEILWVIYIAIIIGGIFPIIGISFKKMNATTKIPFAGFLLIGYLVISYSNFIRFISYNYL